MKTVLITGVAGFIGFHLAKKLLSLGYEVFGVDNLNDYYDVNLKKDRIEILQKYSEFSWNMQDITSRLVVPDDIDLIVNLAAQAGVRHSIDHPEDYIQTNLVGFGNILELARERSIKLVYASSSSVYGNNPHGLCFEDHDTSQAISLYAATKKANEVMAHSYTHLYGIPTIGLRFFTVYGPYGRPDMALSKFTKNILAGEKIDVYNNGDMYRDFTYIDDIIDGIIKALEYDGDIQIFNLGCGETRRLMDFVRLIEKYCGKKADINFMPLQMGDVTRTSADIYKAQHVLGFEPKTKIEEGLKLFVDWYKEYYS